MGFTSGELIAQRYRVVALIGEGTFGAVYRAERLIDGLHVALKVMQDQHAGRVEQRARFERESRLLVELAHPNTVRTLDFGYTESDLPYIALELLHGRTLRDELHDRGALGTRSALYIARQVLLALEAAGRIGIVHRDIKPANIFLLGIDDTVKVLDFGLAKDGRASNAQALTATGQMLGTPHYMAPEQIRAEPVDGRVDIYALGVVLSEICSGRKLVSATSEIEIYMVHVAEAAHELPPSMREGPLGAIVARAVQKDAANRYPTATAMLADIDQVLRSVGRSASTELGVSGTVVVDASQFFEAAPADASEPVSLSEQRVAPSPSWSLRNSQLAPERSDALHPFMHAVPFAAGTPSGGAPRPRQFRAVVWLALVVFAIATSVAAGLYLLR
ncbi:MAG: serine/threonine protein kinase [Myxococcales bacterium]|nr:serine/threonine protein kinase [Myxococcales bacterium]